MVTHQAESTHPTKRRRLRSVGAILVGLGALALLVAATCGYLARSDFSSSTSQLDDSIAVFDDLPESLTLARGAERGLWTDEPSAQPPDCTVVGPAGAKSVDTSGTFEIADTVGTLRYLGEFSAETGGDYTVACSGGDVLLSTATSSSDLTPDSATGTAVLPLAVATPLLLGAGILLYLLGTRRPWRRRGERDGEREG